jgi:hypothetical protein
MFVRRLPISERPKKSPLREAVAISAVLALCSCAEVSQPTEPPLLPAAVKMFPQCMRQMQAFIDITTLAKSYGRDWQLFDDAIDDLREQVLDCIEDARPPIQPANEARRGPSRPPFGAGGESLAPVRATKSRAQSRVPPRALTSARTGSWYSHCRSFPSKVKTT